MIGDSIRAPQPRPEGSLLAIEQALIALRAGDWIEAESTLRRYLLKRPDDADALTKLAEIAIDQRRMDEATVFLRRAADADSSPERRLRLVRHLFAYAGPAVALAEIGALPDHIRDHYDIRVFEASLLGMMGDHDAQIALYEALTTAFPERALLWIGLGNVLKTIGRTEDAVAALRCAIRVEPTCGEAYWTLANFKSFRFDDRDIAAMRKASRGRIGDFERVHFEFALGKAYEDRAEFARSFRHYAAGNRLRLTGIRPDDTRITAFVDRAIATYSRELFERHPGAGCEARDPIFIVGLHRSGSTLIEQILSCHPMIEGTSELPVMQQIWERLVRTAEKFGRDPFDDVGRLDSRAFEEIGAEYIERTRAFRLTDRPMFVDKLPANWVNLGLIKLALPNARVIDARRHPMACGFSNFKQHYRTGVGFAYGLESIGHFYRDYLRFMDHIDGAHPGWVHRLVNERLIDDPEGEIRRLLDYLELPFEPACLDFHRNKRAVRTPSAEQVRRPLNRDGTDLWRRFQPWLGPLEQALGPALSDWDKPAH